MFSFVVIVFAIGGGYGAGWWHRGVRDAQRWSELYEDEDPDIGDVGGEPYGVVDEYE